MMLDSNKAQYLRLSCHAKRATIMLERLHTGKQDLNLFNHNKYKKATDMRNLFCLGTKVLGTRLGRLKRLERISKDQSQSITPRSENPTAKSYAG